MGKREFPLDLRAREAETPAMGRYTFGESDVAAHRLDLLASVFEPTTRDLLTTAVGGGRRSVVDLGCGPGYSTRLIHQTCAPAATVGLDSSVRFVELATGLTSEPMVSFAVHDVTRLPLPGEPFEALYARLLLAHLPDALGLVEGWRGAVGPGGVVVLEEVQTIETPLGVLQAYEDMVAAVVEGGGGSMYAGLLLEPLGGRLVRIDVEPALAARIYRMNLTNWRDDAIAQGLAGPHEVDRIAAGLDALQSGAISGSVGWVVRQVVLAG
ncbi:MAG TPA: class I SAM-dependent methyltransferase [Acidimicrobiales bacterium]